MGKNRKKVTTNGHPKKPQIFFTSHAQLRAKERLGIESTSQLKTIAQNSMSNGINLFKALEIYRANNYDPSPVNAAFSNKLSKLNKTFSAEELNYFAKKFSNHGFHQVYYWYNNSIFVFRNNTLWTIIQLDEEAMRNKKVDKARKSGALYYKASPTKYIMNKHYDPNQRKNGENYGEN